MNLFDKGNLTVDNFDLNYELSGKLEQVIPLFWNPEFGRVLMVEYTDYMVLYDCSFSGWDVFDFTTDQLHIYTRTGTLTDAHRTTIITDITARMPSFNLVNLEKILTKDCLELTLWSQIGKAFSDPEYFWRK